MPPEGHATWALQAFLTCTSTSHGSYLGYKIVDEHYPEPASRTAKHTTYTYEPPAATEQGVSACVTVTRKGKQIASRRRLTRLIRRDDISEEIMKIFRGSFEIPGDTAGGTSENVSGRRRLS